MKLLKPIATVYVLSIGILISLYIYSMVMGITPLFAVMYATLYVTSLLEILLFAIAIIVAAILYLWYYGIESIFN